MIRYCHFDTVLEFLGFCLMGFILSCCEDDFRYMSALDDSSESNDIKSKNADLLPDTRSNESYSPLQDCEMGYQDNDGDGKCEADCATANISCSQNGRCNDSTGVARCDCFAGFVDDNGGNCVPNQFMVTSVSDNLNAHDAEIFSSRLEELGFSRENWDQNVNKTTLSHYLNQPYILIYHTGHGFTGGIATANGVFKADDVTINAQNTIFATCFTLKEGDWKQAFGDTAQTVMGYTKESFDVVDERVVSRYADHLHDNQTHFVAWYLSNNSIDNLSDRWAAYVREEDDIILYRARNSVSQIVPLSYKFTPLGTSNPLQISDAVLANIPNVANLYPISINMERGKQSKRIYAANKPFSNMKPSTFEKQEAVDYATKWLQENGHDEDSLFLDRVIAVERKVSDDSLPEIVAHEVRFGRKVAGMPLRSNGTADHISVTVGNGKTLFFSKYWSEITTTLARRAPLIMQPNDAITIAKDEIVRAAKGRPTHIVDVVPVMGTDGNPSSGILEPAYGFRATGGEVIVVSAVTGKILN